MKDRSEEREEYEYIKAIVDGGDLRWEYRLVGSHVTGRMAHDEDVTGLTCRHITDLTCSILNVEPGQRKIVQVEYR